nr:aspartyl/asparaginyl beta-hydroxylase domain-containing protein [Hufsiella ginkgonis]
MITGRWHPHLNSYHYEGGWEVLSLRSPGGLTHNTVPDLQGEDAFEDTPLMDQCPAIRSLTRSFTCPVMSVRLLNLKAGALIKPHRDRELSFEQGEARIHLPVHTNDGVEFYVEDDRVIMPEGSCWYINANLPHRVANKGAADRVHLVIDCKVNDWLTMLFGDSEQKTRDLPFDADVQRQIIESLRLQRHEAAAALALQLEQELLAYLPVKSVDE